MKLNRTLLWTNLSAITLSFVSGCGANSGSNSSDENYTEGAPELAAVQMRLTGDGNSEAVATDNDSIDPAAVASDELAAVADDAGTLGTPDLNGARAAIRDLNQALRSSLSSVVALVRTTEPTIKRGDLRVWGPVTRGQAEFRFFMRKPALHRFQWRLDARAAGTAAVWSRIAAGEILVGARARRGVGTAGFDLTNLATVDPNVTSRGQVLAGFAHGPLGTTLTVGLRSFTRDPSVEPVDALLQEVHLSNDVNRVRLAYRGNVQGTASDAEELVLARVRHTVGVGGRSDMIVTEGDVPAGNAWVVSQCWDKALEQTYRIVRDCPLDGIGGGTCTEISVVGDSKACDANWWLPELPPVDKNAVMTDEQNPNGEVAPPASIPDVADDTAD